jgi:hypothetical protein
MDKKQENLITQGGSAGRRLTRGSGLAILLAVAILLCALFRQCYIAMPWDETAICGVKLAWLRRPLAVAFFTASFWGVCLSMGVLFWRAVTGIVAQKNGELFGGFWGRIAQSGTAAWLCLLCVVCCLCTVLFPLTDEGVALPAGLSDWFDRSLFMARQFLYASVILVGAKLTVDSAKKSVNSSAQTSLAAAGLIVLLLVITGASMDWFYQGEMSSMFPLSILAYVATLGMATTLALAPTRSDGTKWVASLMLVTLLFKIYFLYSQSLIVWYADVPAEQTALILRHNGVWSTWGEVTLGVGTILPALLCALPVVRRSAQVLRVLGFWIMLASLAEAFWLIAPLKLIATPFSLAGLLLIISTIIVVGLMVLMSFTVSRKK